MPSCHMPKGKRELDVGEHNVLEDSTFETFDLVS